MRRILLLITDLEIGGTPTVVREVAARLSRMAGVAVHVACLAPWGPVADQIRRAGVAVTALGARGVADWAVVPRLLRLLKEHRIDTVFSFLIHANAVAAVASLASRNIRYIQSIQTTQPCPRWHWWLQGVVQEAAETIVVPSPSVAWAAEQWSAVPRRKIVMIPNAVAVGEYERVRDLPAAQIRIDPAAGGAIPIGFIGRLDPVKRLPDLLAAVKQLAGKVHLHVFGEGRDRPRVEARIRELGIGASVTLHGATDRPQDALKQVDLLVLPSEAEGFGLVLIEAMAAGVPVVATNAGGIRDVVVAGETGLLVPVGQPQRLAEAIAMVLGNEELRRRLVARASADVRARFSWESVFDQYCDLLRVGARHSPPL